MADIGIGELARRTGVPASTLRWWERQHVLPAPPRSDGRRRYDAAVVRRVALIRMCQKAGFTLAEIRELTSGTTDLPARQQWEQLARRKLPDLDQLVDQLTRLRDAVASCLECGCMRFERCQLLDPA